MTNEENFIEYKELGKSLDNALVDLRDFQETKYDDYENEEEYHAEYMRRSEKVKEIADEYYELGNKLLIDS